MLGLIIFSAFIYVVSTINLSVLRSLIDDGVFSNPFWTRSLRGIFIMPPFAIMVYLGIILKDSISYNLKNLKFIMTKRKDTQL